jgi:hypothetical protein
MLCHRWIDTAKLYVTCGNCKHSLHLYCYQTDLTTSLRNTSQCLHCQNEPEKTDPCNYNLNVVLENLIPKIISRL